MRSCLTLAFSLAVCAPMHSQPSEPVEAKQTESNMMEGCEKMKQQREKMLAEMKALDAELTEQVAVMNSAPADKKVDLMAALITKMLEQRIDLVARKTKMEEHMMEHMMKHMEMGKESIAQCPMMKAMKGMNGKPDDASKQLDEQPK
jgi:hypothetical protein